MWKRTSGEIQKRGDMVKIMGQENDHCSSILNGYEQNKIVFFKARKKDVAVMQNDESLDESSRCVDGQERPSYRCYARFRYSLDVRTQREVQGAEDTHVTGLSQSSYVCSYMRSCKKLQIKCAISKSWNYLARCHWDTVILDQGQQNSAATLVRWTDRQTDTHTVPTLNEASADAGRGPLNQLRKILQQIYSVFDSLIHNLVISKPIFSRIRTCRRVFLSQLATFKLQPLQLFFSLNKK